MPSFFDIKQSNPIHIKNTPFDRTVTFVAKEKKAFVNIHAYPNWVLYINNKKINSYDYFLRKQTDGMGRPILTVVPGRTYTVRVRYEQTSIKILANIITGGTLLLCTFFAFWPIQIKRESTS